eukprot:jgi/Ulvmu1/10162/UM006_0116.1
MLSSQSPAGGLSQSSLALLKPDIVTTKELGHGGCGTVYLAEVTATQQVAVKMGLTPSQEQLLCRETVAMDAVRGSPFILPVIGYLPGPTIDRIAAMALPVCHDGSLDALLERRYQLRQWAAASTGPGGPPASPFMERGEWLPLAYSLTSAAHHTHQKGYAHLDVKPGNIVRESEAGPWKLIDFGIAEALNSRICSMCGTKGYMAPEVKALSGDAARDGGSVVVSPILDARAVAITLAQAALGLSTKDVARVAKAGALRQQLLCCASPDVATVITRGLAKRPEDRASVAEMLLYIRRDYYEAEERELLGCIAAQRVATPQPAPPLPLPAAASIWTPAAAPLPAVQPAAALAASPAAPAMAQALIQVAAALMAPAAPHRAVPALAAPSESDAGGTTEAASVSDVDSAWLTLPATMPVTIARAGGDAGSHAGSTDDTELLPEPLATVPDVGHDEGAAADALDAVMRDGTEPLPEAGSASSSAQRYGDDSILGLLPRGLFGGEDELGSAATGPQPLVDPFTRFPAATPTAAPKAASSVHDATTDAVAPLRIHECTALGPSMIVASSGSTPSASIYNAMKSLPTADGSSGVQHSPSTPPAVAASDAQSHVTHALRRTADGHSEVAAAASRVALFPVVDLEAAELRKVQLVQQRKALKRDPGVRGAKGKRARRARAKLRSAIDEELSALQQQAMAAAAAVLPPLPQLRPSADGTAAAGAALPPSTANAAQHMETPLVDDAWRVGSALARSAGASCSGSSGRATPFDFLPVWQHSAAGSVALSPTRKGRALFGRAAAAEVAEEAAALRVMLF